MSTVAFDLKSLVQPKYSVGRVAAALTVAVVADGLQLLLGPVGWAGLDDVIDVVAMALTTLALGFHIVFLPTFVLELVPVAGMLPTWTGCVLAVALLRRRQLR
jgi:uncharacterized membrane protein